MVNITRCGFCISFPHLGFRDWKERVAFLLRHWRTASALSQNVIAFFFFTKKKTKQKNAGQPVLEHTHMAWNPHSHVRNDCRNPTTGPKFHVSEPDPDCPSATI